MEMYLYFSLVYFSFIQDSWCYFVSNTNATWTEADTECKMATPTILYERLKLDITIDKPILNLGVWVGYYEHMALFDYIGCIKTKNIQPIPTAIQLGKSTPGRCYSACSYSQYIGIEQRKCYCFDTEPGKKITEQECNEPCDDMSQTVCGGKDHISLYRISTNDTDIIKKRGEHKCLQINFSDGAKYNWKDCKEDQMWASCISDSTQQEVKILQETKSWNDAAKLCFQHKSYPTRFVDIIQISDNNKYFWTGVVRSGVISKSTELGNISSDIMYGYMTYNIPSGYVLKFTQENDKKYILCGNEEPPTSSVPETENATTTTDVSTNPGNKGLDEEEVADTLGISVTVSTLIVVIFVVVAVMLMKKRRTNQETRLTEVGYVPEQTNNVTHISDEAGDGAYTTIQSNGTGGASKEIGIQNPQKIVYESLGERNDKEHGYGTANTQRRAYESLGKRHDEEHSYGTPNTHRNAYESLGDRQNKHTAMKH
ncbi:uncharacterized protein LOC123559451 isoform X2 [Mercenaria mercenaria]|uniref:uncharacterized protein LOC123559451 isoform X2 n=1 Tax=Mercenaria mercenaria TaxID=6596 RepID=UPI00234E6AF4|nr:uncharacterized protein LOC123559451 isoform X2 [Mercenaria mercenaria]